MLEKLTIVNHSLITRVDIDFKPGFTVITGATGSGKSIMMDALSLVLGERADTGVLKNAAEKCVVEALFRIEESRLKALLEKHDLDFDDRLILRREINPQGKSRAFVNDTPVNVSTLKEIGEQLVDIHSQHEHLLIADENFRIGAQDALAKNESQVRAYRLRLVELKKAEAELEKLQKQVLDAKAEEAFLRHQTDELNAFPLDDIDEESLTNQLRQAENSEEILRAIGSVTQMLDAEENGIVPTVKHALQILEKTSRTDSRLEPIAERLRQNFLDLADLSSELEQVAHATVTNPEEAGRIAGLLDKLYTLLQKHRVSNAAELIGLRDIFRQKLAQVENADEVLEETRKRCEVLREDCQKMAAQISSGRKAVIPGLEKSVHGYLARVGLDRARFVVKMEPRETLGENGADRISFLFSANPGMALQPAEKVASGGEISRLMLCLKFETARHRSVPTLVLDEADTGTGGETARKIGLLLAETGLYTQLAVITHLPQIAAKASHHFQVTKESRKGSSDVKIEELDLKGREEALAEMLSGADFTEAALANARELMRS